MKTIEEILAKDDSHRETVNIPEWETDVLIVSMTAQERADIEKLWSGKKAYFEACTNKSDAKRREHYLKTTGGRRFLAKRLIAYYKSKL